MGFNVNVCWGHGGIRDIDYDTIWDYVVLPMVEEFVPDIILISAGFDAGILCIHFIKIFSCNFVNREEQNVMTTVSSMMNKYSH
jgi:hypothetical protein